MHSLIKDESDKLSQKIIDGTDWTLAWHPAGMVTADSKQNLLYQLKQKKNLFNPDKAGNIIDGVAAARPSNCKYCWVGQVIRFSSERHSIVSEDEWRKNEQYSLRLMMYLPLATDALQLYGEPEIEHEYDTLDTKKMHFVGKGVWPKDAGAWVYVAR